MKHAYIPDIPGRERRKKTASKAGTLGVEGMRPEVLVEALRRAGATFEGAESSGGEAEELSAADMYALGLSGRPGSAALRAALLAELGLPGKLQGASLRGVLSALYTREELERALSALPAPQ